MDKPRTEKQLAHDREMRLNPLATGTGRPKGSKSLRSLMLAKLETMFTGEDDQEKDTFIIDYLKQFKESAKAGGWAAKYLWEALAGKDPIEAIDKILGKAKREDEDFESYRILIDCHDIQKEIITSASRAIHEMAGRRAGKTVANRKKIAHDGKRKLHRQSNARFLVIHLTITKAIEQYYNGFIEDFEKLGYDIVAKSVTDGVIKTRDGIEIYLRGNNTKDEREKFRGDQWDGIVIEEAQSQKALDYLIDEVLLPTLLDRKGWVMLSGTGPRIRGTAWERRFIAARNDASRGRSWNWNITHNPFIPDHDKVLEEVLAKNGWTRTTPIFVREYLGQISYDDDALIIRLNPQNFFEDTELAKWINTQPVTDLHFTAGLDFGFTDSDGFVIVLYSDSRPEKWIVYQYKKNRIGTGELADAIKAGLKYTSDHPMFARIPDKFIQIYADSSHGITSYDLNTIYGLPVIDAYKQNKDLAYENLQEDVRKGNVRLRHSIWNEEGICVNDPFEDECNKAVFKRNDEESSNPYQLTREVDDETYHPDIMDAVLYAMRRIWVYAPREGNVIETTEKSYFDAQMERIQNGT